MQIRLHLKFLLAFFILVLLLNEAHELAHHFAAYLACGCFGERDFLLWALCKDCDNSNAFMITAFAGPLITYTFMWTGFFLLDPKRSVLKRCWGFAIVMASLPFARLLAAATRGGDEIMAMRKILEGDEPFHGAAVVAGGLLVLLLSAPPLWRAFKFGGNNAAVFIFICFVVLPYLLQMLVVEHGMNTLFKSGFLNNNRIMGISLLIILWEVLLVLLCILTCRGIRLLSHSSNS